MRRWRLPILLIVLVASGALVVCSHVFGPTQAGAAEEAVQTSAPETQIEGASDSGDQPKEKYESALMLVFLISPVGAVLALIAAYYFYRWMRRQDEGTESMREIANYVREGAFAYLRQQYKVVLIFFIIAGLLLLLMSLTGLQHWLVPLAFITGGFFSALAGFFGMKTATMASNRAAAAARLSLNGSLKVAFRSGAVMGLVVVGLGLLYICIWFPLCLYVLGMSLPLTVVTMLSFGMGASAQALFARVGGGIFTKAADVGADLVGKVEAGIPEDDPRNPATIADNVGDNVGDVAGMGADLYESYCNSILAAAVLGVAAGYGLVGVVLPVVIAGVGIMLSIVGIFVVRTKEDATQKTLIKALARGVNLSAWAITIVSFFLTYYLLGVYGPLTNKQAVGVWLAIIAGLFGGIVIGKATEYFTSADFAPTRSVSEQSKTGPATVIIGGLSIGMLSTGIPVLVIGLVILLSYGFAGGFADAAAGLFGVGLAAVGMLSTLGITLSTDAYGPIADNAGGNAEMTGQEPCVRERTDALDSLGNTTAATGKGFAIGSAALTAMVLIAAYIEAVRVGLVSSLKSGATFGFLGIPAGLPGDVGTWSIEHFMDAFNVTLMNPRLLTGLFLGAGVAFVFCALTMRAVGNTASRMVEEVRRQFREIPGIMDSTSKPDYAACVKIATVGAQRSMVVPSLMAIVTPVIVGVTLGVAGTVGLLAGGLSTGFVLAVMMANAGGAWDNAKKYIEAGALGGKGSPEHKAAVVGDTVGDPFKDTSGPSLNILIKLMSMVAVVSAGLTVGAFPWFRDLALKLFHLFGW